MRRSFIAPLGFAVGAACLVSAGFVSSGEPFVARDPGVRAGADAGNPFADLTATELEFFRMGNVAFLEAEGAADGLGPTMNLDNCGGCHSMPSTGGTSPAKNPQVALAKFNRVNPAGNLPAFVTADGPVRVARFLKKADGSPDGTVHALLTITDRPDAPGCSVAQQDFAPEIARRNVVFRIPTPVFGAGLIEQIPDSAVRANQAANAERNQALGIRGRPNTVVSNRSNSSPGGDPIGRIGRFGWKAHNASLLVAAAEAYRDEMGITNELFSNEPAPPAGCQFLTMRYGDGELDGVPAIDSLRRYLNPKGHRYPLEATELKDRAKAFAARNPPGDYLANTDGQASVDSVASIEKFASYMRYLAPPLASRDAPGGPGSIARGKAAFADVGCAACHTPMMHTGKASVASLRDRPVELYSDLLLHDMGPGLADGIAQERAGPSEFRTSPLWGLGQRIYFLHDGRTQDLRVAITEHRSGSTKSGDASEANTVVDRFDALGENDKQDLLNFLRSL